MAIDVLNALSGYEKKKSPAEELAASQLIEDERTAEALKSLIEQVPTSVMEAGRAPSTEKKTEVTSKPSKIIPKYNPVEESVKKGKEGLDRLATQIEQELSGKISPYGKTTEQINKQVSESAEQRPTLAAEQSNINLLQDQIDELEGKKAKKKQEFESYLDQAIADVAKKPEGMGLMELVGKSMLALAPGLIGAKIAGYRGGQYAAEGSSKALQALMETEETRRQAAQKIQAEMSKVRASLSKDEIDKIADLQKELIKGQLDLRTLPLKNQLELTRLLSAKELTKDQSYELAKLLKEIRDAQIESGAQRPESVGRPRSKAADEAQKKPTSSEFKAAGFAKRAILAEQKLQDLSNQGFNRADYGTALQSALPNVARSGLYKQYQQAEDEFIMAVKRDESGAAVKDSEREEYAKLYHPRGGDTPEVLEQKRLSREQKIAELVAEAGGAFENVKQVSVAPKAPVLTKEIYEKMTAEEAIEYKSADSKRKIELIKKAQGRK